MKWLGFLDIEERPVWLNSLGNQLEVSFQTVDLRCFELIWTILLPMRMKANEAGRS